MPIYLIRHGQSEFNAAFNGRDDPMIHDPRLTKLGREQAITARETAAELGIKHVIVSPLTRALQTATHIFGDRLPVKVMSEPRELLSHSSDIGRAPGDLKKDFPHLSFDHLADVWWHQGELNAHSVPIEPRDAFMRRIKGFAENLNQITDRPVAIVGHWNTFMELAGFDMSNCEIRQYLP